MVKKYTIKFYSIYVIYNNLNANIEGYILYK